MSINREVSLTQNAWTKVAGATDGPVVFTCDNNFTWAVASDTPGVTGFAGTSGTLVSLLPNTCGGGNLYVYVTASGKKCSILGGNIKA